MKFFKLLVILLIAVLIAIPIGCKKKELVAKGNGIEVTKEDVKKQVDRYLKQSGLPKNLPADQKKMLEKQINDQVVESLIREQVLIAGAKNEGIDISDEDINKRLEEIKKSFPSAKEFQDLLKKQDQTEEDVKKFIKTQMIIEKLKGKLSKNKTKVSDKDVEDYYNKNKFQFQDQETVKARHILLKTSKSANEVLAKIKAGGDFTKLAKEFSTDPGSKENGGDLGYFDRNQMVPEFSKVAFSLKVGTVSEVVKSKFGYHIIKVEDKKKGKQKSLSEVKEQIKTMISQQQEGDIINKWIDEQKKELGVKKV